MANRLDELRTEAARWKALAHQRGVEIGDLRREVEHLQRVLQAGGHPRPPEERR